MPPPSRLLQPHRFARRRRWEQVIEMKSSTTSGRLACNSGPQQQAKLSMNCHPERSEGPASRRKMRNSLHRWLQAAALALAVLALMGAGDDNARFKDLGHRMMCTCGCGQVLLECNHVGCQSSDKMRNQLLAALNRSGGGGNGGGGSAISDDLILQGLVQEYGPTVIAA